MKRIFSFGALWTRREYKHGPVRPYGMPWHYHEQLDAAKLYDEFHFIILSESKLEQETHILVLNGEHAGEIMLFNYFEESRRRVAGKNFDFETYCPVMDDDIQRIKF
jgi:hypothetical protein